jgi:hypothetical protein
MDTERQDALFALRMMPGQEGDENRSHRDATLRMTRKSERLRADSRKRRLSSRYRAVEAPEAGVAVIAAIGPNKGQAEPDTLDEPAPGRAANRGAGTYRTLVNSLGKGEIHGLVVLSRFR